MMDEQDVGQETERIIAGGLGLVLVGTMTIRLCRWYAGDGRYKTVWGAMVVEMAFEVREYDRRQERIRMDQLIACCGLDCEKCDARIATVTSDDALREKTAAFRHWKG